MDNRRRVWACDDLYPDKDVLWPKGRWTDEPDYVAYEDVATGLVCMARRHSETGYWCAYVGVGPDSPMYGSTRLNDPRVTQLRVHGGVNFTSTLILDVDFVGRWFFGFCCAVRGIDLAPLGKWDDGSPCVGGEYRPLEYVIEQCAQLAAQLAVIRFEGGQRR